MSYADARSGEQQQSIDIAPEAIDGAVHIIPQTLSLDLFAEEIRPPTVVDSLPALPDDTYPQGALVFLTSDEKLYRNTDGSTWSVAVEGTDIVANSITAGQIAVGAIGADEIAAGAITTEKFHVGAFAPNVENSTSEVLIDDEGITILNGKIRLIDYSGQSVLNPAGFAGGWTDYISTGVYQGYFKAISGSVTAPTLVGDADTEEDYEASLSPNIPYWVLESVEGATIDGVTVGSFSYLRFMLEATAGDELILFQDIPNSPGFKSVYLGWSLHDGGVTGTVEAEVTVEDRGLDHESLDTPVSWYSETIDLATGLPSHDPVYFTINNEAPYIRVKIRITRLTGSGTAELAITAVRLERQPHSVDTGDIKAWGISLVASGGSEIGDQGNMLHFATAPFGGLAWGDDYEEQLDLKYTSGLIGGSTFYDGVEFGQGDDHPGTNESYFILADSDLAFASVIGAEPDVFLRRSAAAELTLSAGVLRVSTSGSATPTSTDHGFQVGLDSSINIRIDGNEIMAVNNGAASELHINRSGGTLNFGASASAPILMLNQGIIEMVERGNPAAPAANQARIFVRDNGAGKTQLVVRFPTGAVQVISTEP